MEIETLTMTSTAAPIFPATDVGRRLREELERIAEESSVVRPEWEPLLPSKLVVGVVLTLEDLFSFKLPPDKVVRKGGYNGVDEAMDDMLDRIEKVWVERSKARVRT